MPALFRMEAIGCRLWLHCRDFQGASFDAVAAFDTIGMKEAFCVIPTLIRLQLHWAYRRAELAFGGTFFTHHNAAVVVWKSAAAWSHPR